MHRLVAVALPMEPEPSGAVRAAVVAPTEQPPERPEEVPCMAVRAEALVAVTQRLRPEAQAGCRTPTRLVAERREERAVPGLTRARRARQEPEPLAVVVVVVVVPRPVQTAVMAERVALRAAAAAVLVPALRPPAGPAD